LLDERITLAVLAGGVIVVAGVYVGALSRRSGAAPATEPTAGEIV
jgi:hypothetical protein